MRLQKRKNKKARQMQNSKNAKASDQGSRKQKNEQKTCEQKHGKQKKQKYCDVEAKCETPTLTTIKKKIGGENNCKIT